MTYPINPKYKIFQWGPIDGRPLYPDYWGHGCLSFTKNFPPGWPVFLAYIEKEKFYCLLPYNRLYANGEEVFKKYILDAGKFKKNYQKWNGILKIFNTNIRNITPKNLKKLDQAAFIKLLTRWNFLYGTLFWNIGSLPEVANWGGEKMLSTELKKHLKNKNDFNLAFEKLSAPENFSFYQKEEFELLEIKLAARNKARALKLRTHQKKYFWLLNSYHHTQILGLDYFKNIMSGISREQAEKKYAELKDYKKNIRIQKVKIIKKFNLPKKIVRISDLVSFCVWWQDLRKAYIFNANHIIDIFLGEISARYKVNFDDLHYYNLGELEKLALKKESLTNKELKARRTNFLAIYTGRENRYMTGASARKLVAPYLKISKQANISSFKGITTSPGKISGRVKIISTAREINKLNKGEILVTPMTSPDYIMGLRKAGAVITDHGGMTCHAAIVSRELGIPCIVGTKIATHILKDHDLVEVDADYGLVKILKR